MTEIQCRFFQPEPDKYRTCINLAWHHNGSYRCGCEGKTDLCNFWNNPKRGDE